MINMNAYILIILADILLAAVFLCQKEYQKVAGTTVGAGLWYNALMGAFSAIMFLIINRFEVKLTPYSVIMAVVFAIVAMLYIFIGFRIMKNGNMSLYTMFLMSGGMTVPYIWGVLFLNEELTLFRIIGLVAIIIAIVISNSGARKPGKMQILMCVAVFLLNGVASVTSKLHQINPASEVVTSSDFAFLVMVFKALICFTVITVCGKKLKYETTKKLPGKKIIPIVLLAAVLDGISYMLQLVGAINIPATVLYPLVTGFSVILTAIAGAVVLREKLSARQWTGVAICFVGTLFFL